MTRQTAARYFAFLSIAITCCFTLADSPPSTQPAKTGAFDITFTDRSPLSNKKELSQRLNLKLADMGDDYDISQRPYRIYVPSNYDPSTPCGLFVYLGYKDSVSTPPEWNAALDQAHMIFITSICHTGDHYPNSVPLWQTTGLALDAVYNLKKQYAIDPNRLYLMSNTVHATQVAIATADAFTGDVISVDPFYFRRVTMPNGGFFPIDFTLPTGGLMSRARNHPIFLIGDNQADIMPAYKAKAAMMKQDGFHLTLVFLSLDDDLHYPHFKVDWFQKQALPFLDGAAKPGPQPPTPPEAPGSSSPIPKPPEPSPAQHLLTMAQLYINGGQPDIAKQKLQEIIDTYPDDPAAAKAKQLLQQLNNQ